MRFWNDKLDTLIINYTNTNLFSPTTARSSNGGTRVIGIFARYHPQKNYENFVKAVKKVTDEGFEGLKFVWHGSQQNTDGSVNPHYEKFKSLVSANGLEAFIALESPTNNVVDCINSCDAICLPSIYEGFSNSLSEAISCGKIVIASNVSDNPVMVIDGHNGFTFNPMNIDEMANAIKKYMTLSIEEVRTFEKNSREHALKLFDIENFTMGYVDIIENV